MLPEPVEFSGDEEQRKERASGPVLSQIKRAEKEFEDWQATCGLIDEIYSLHGSTHNLADDYHWSDSTLDMFWASYEILRPAIYARPPKPAVAPMFRDKSKLLSTTAEVLERVAHSTFTRSNIDDVMVQVRDDLIFAGRGVMWLRYESDEGQKVCIEHLDRTDFCHEPARKWSEVGWVAARFWLTRDEMRKRFSLSDDKLENAKYTLRRDKHHNEATDALTQKAGVWEVWHRADKRVYWVTEGIDTLLDSSAPHLKLSGFFPCPRPAFATLRRRSLVPVPDWERYAVHFRKISDLTGRIYLLLDQVRMMGLIGGGGDLSDAIEDVLTSKDDRIIVRVNTIANIAESVAWLPLRELAEAIQGLIQARQQLIDDFYQLSGISDIMRGATEAEETLGAQQLKSQYGSVRVRGRIDELQRVAADAVKIAAEVIADNFTADTLLDMAQMEIPTRKVLKDRITEIEKAADAEMKALGAKAEEMATQAQDADPQAIEQQFQQAQQQLVAKYAPMLEEAQGHVPIEDIIDLLRDDRARSFAFEIESDSTILTDELQEKQSRAEFMDAFARSSQSMMSLAAMGEAGARLAGEMMKFSLAPYRAGRQLDGAIDAFIETAPEMAAMAAGQEGESEALAEANNKLAEAEMQKAKAAMAGVEAKAALDKAEMQRKLMEMQQKAHEAEFKSAAETEKLRQSLTAEQAKTAHIEAQINKLTAETAAILSKIGLDMRQQELAEHQASEQSQQNQIETSLAVEGAQTEREFRERGEQRADRQQEFTEQQGAEQ